MTTDSIAIIVLNWQNWQDTLHCLNSLKQLNFSHPIYIIVCDNHSPNDSWRQLVTWTQQHYAVNDIHIFEQPPQLNNTTSLRPITLIQTGQNLGFAGGNNAGIRYVLSQHHIRYVWLLNNDTAVDSQALQHLYYCAKQHPYWGMIGSTVLEFDQPDIIQCAGGCRYYPYLSVFKNNLAGYTINTLTQENINIKLDYVYGASLFLPTDTIRQTGLLNETYFLFYEELDYTQRLKKHGFQIGWCQKSKVYHKGSASIGSRKENNIDKLKIANYYENLNTLKYTARFHPFLLPVIMLVRLTLKPMILLKRREWRLFSPLIRAFWDFFRK